MSWWEGSRAHKDLGDQHSSQREQKIQSPEGKTKWIPVQSSNTLKVSLTLTPRTSGEADRAGSSCQEMMPPNQPSRISWGRKSIRMEGNNTDYHQLSILHAFRVGSTTTLRVRILQTRNKAQRGQVRVCTRGSPEASPCPHSEGSTFPSHSTCHTVLFLTLRAHTRSGSLLPQWHWSPSGWPLNRQANCEEDHPAQLNAWLLI